MGFPRFGLRASLAHAHRDFHHDHAIRSQPPRNDYQRQQRVAEARLRAAIVLLSADGVGTNDIMRRTAKSKTCVWRWQERFMEEGTDGLLRDKTRPSRIPPLGPEVAERVVALTLTDPSAETTHWTADLMARASGISCLGREERLVNTSGQHMRFRKALLCLPHVRRLLVLVDFANA